MGSRKLLILAHGTPGNRDLVASTRAGEREGIPVKYVVEDWLTEEIIRVFSSEEDREKWLRENVNRFSDGGYLDDGTKISIYETVDIHDKLNLGGGTHDNRSSKSRQGAI